MRKKFGERVAMNSPIRGTAADIIKLAMIRVHKRPAEAGIPARMILQVHDELISASRSARLCRAGDGYSPRLHGARGYPVCAAGGWMPHIGKNWFEAH